MIKILFFTILTTYYLLLTTSLASADDFSLGISPQILTIEADKGQNIETEIEIENFSDRPVTLSVSYKEFTNSLKNDNYIEFKTNSEEFKKLTAVTQIFMDEIEVKRFSLNPHQKQKLVLKSTIPLDLPTRDYTFTVLFQDISPSAPPQTDGSVFSRISGGIGLNVLMSVDKKEFEKVDITEFSTQFLIQKGPVSFTIRAQNPGNHFISPQGTIRIYNMFGQLIGKFNLPKLNILSKKSRTYIDPEIINKPDNNDIKDIKIDQKISWPEEFLLGFYTANLQLQPETGEKEEKTIHFLVLPYNVLVITITVLALILLIKIRINHYLNSKR